MPANTQPMYPVLRALRAIQQLPSQYRSIEIDRSQDQLQLFVTTFCQLNRIDQQALWGDYDVHLATQVQS